MTRTEERSKSADWLCGLSPDKLFERWEITRVAELTDLDIIGVPVWSAIRPMGNYICVSGGKNLSNTLARAAAIGEAIETSIMEKPKRESCRCRPYSIEVLDNFPLLRDPIPDDLLVSEELVCHYQSGKKVHYPSNLIWLDLPRGDLWQRSSNGQALGSTINDAILTGLYECVERDAWTLRRALQKKYDLVPQQVDLSDAPPQVSELIRRCNQAGIEVIIFEITLDIKFPIYQAMLLGGDFAPAAGYGTSIQSAIAIESAILEAIQTRAVFIAGARNDVTDKDLEEWLGYDQKMLSDALSKTTKKKKPDWTIRDLTTEFELGVALFRLGPWMEKMLVKIASIDPPCVKVIIHGLEVPYKNEWRPMKHRWGQIQRAYETLSYIQWSNSVRRGLSSPREHRVMVSSSGSR